ncbi:hypothetical protein [Paenibacillus sp. FSL W8-0194]|uniref:hypothetical protein n=1 Tax=Paenibacillus sp. FSL W8-0194 TaxID=2921711 RepID=UPI0030DA4A16
MAETMNYRMNLVIDPKNVIKANRELRAMERYFERIQGRVLRIGRTRMAPEIVLKDRASKGLDNLLHKLQRVRSEVVNASANINLTVKHTSGQQPDFSPLVQVLQGNTKALLELTKALGSLKIGGAAASATAPTPEKPKTVWDKLKDGFGAMKTFGGGVKSAAEVPGKFKKVGEAWQGKIPEDQKGDASKSGTAKDEDQPITKTRKERIEGGRLPKRTRILNTVGAVGDLVSTFGSAGADLIGGSQDLWKTGKEWLGIGSKATNAASSAANATGAATSAASAASTVTKATSAATNSVSSTANIASSAAKVAGNGGVGAMASGLIKGGLKKLPGPLGLVGDVMSIASAKPGKERAQAIGSTIGSNLLATAGGAIGTFLLPGVGTAVGTVLGDMAGDFLGGKIGGFIADSAPKIKETFTGVSNWFSKNILGKKDKPKDKEDVSKKPDVIRTPAVPEKQPLLPPAPLMQRPTLPPYPPSSPYYQSYQMGMGMTSPQNMNMAGPGPRMQSAVTNNATSAGGKIPQVVQISPEQLTTLSGFLRDMKTETTTQYNLPPGAVQVTVHEEYPVDVEGIIQQVGQRLRAEFAKATQNRKPQSMALA